MIAENRGLKEEVEVMKQLVIHTVQLRESKERLTAELAEAREELRQALTAAEEVLQQRDELRTRVAICRRIVALAGSATDLVAIRGHLDRLWAVLGPIFLAPVAKARPPRH